MVFSTLALCLSCLTFNVSGTPRIVRDTYIEFTTSRSSDIDDESQIATINVDLIYEGVIYRDFITCGWEYDDSDFEIQDFYINLNSPYLATQVDSNVYVSGYFYMNDGYGNENSVNSSFVYASKYVENTSRYWSTRLESPIDSTFEDVQYEFTLRIYLIPSSIYELLDDGSHYQSGYDNGYNTGYADGDNNGYTKGFGEGYDKGREDFENQDSQINSIFEGILSIGLLPIEFFLSIFNFEIFGINITAIVSAILSLCVIILLMRYVLGGKSN